VMKEAMDPGVIMNYPDMVQSYAYSDTHVLRKIPRDKKKALPLFDLDVPVIVISNEAEDAAARRNGLIKDFLSSPFLGMDTESSQKLKVRKPSVVQLASENLVVLWNLKRFKKAPKSLASILESDTYKICHNEACDTTILYTDWGIDTRRVLDTQKLAEAIASDNLSLSDLCAAFLQRSLSKKLQQSNWDRDTLSPSQVTYAAKDAVVTLQIFMHMYVFARANGIMIPEPTSRTSNRKHREFLMKHLKAHLQQLGEYVERVTDMRNTHPIESTISRWKGVLDILEFRTEWPDTEIPRIDDPEVLESARTVVRERIQHLDTPAARTKIVKHQSQVIAKQVVVDLVAQIQDDMEFPKGYPGSARYKASYERAREWLELGEWIEGVKNQNLVRKEAVAFIDKKISKLRSQTEVEVAEYHQRQRISQARAFLRETKTQFEQSMALRRKKKSTSYVEWVARQIKKTEGPHKEDSEFCNVVLKLAAEFDEEIQEAQQRCSEQQHHTQYLKESPTSKNPLPGQAESRGGN